MLMLSVRSKVGAVQAGLKIIIQDTDSDQSELARLLQTLAAADLLLVSRPDRLSRSTAAFFTTVAAVQQAGAQIQFLIHDEQIQRLPDLSSPAGRTIIADVIGISELERQRLADAGKQSEFADAYARAPSRLPKSRYSRGFCRLAEGRQASSPPLRYIP